MTVNQAIDAFAKDISMSERVKIINDLEPGQKFALAARLCGAGELDLAETIGGRAVQELELARVLWSKKSSLVQKGREDK